MGWMMNKPLYGEVWYINLDPTLGHEQAKLRPCLIISTNTFNKGPAELHIVLPITSKEKNNPFHIPVSPPHGGLTKKSFILCDQIRTISRKRIIGSCLGSIPQDIMEDVKHIIKVLLEI